MEVKKYKMARSWLTDPDSGNSAGQWKNFVQQRKQEWKTREGFKGAGLVEHGPAGVRQGYKGEAWGGYKKQQTKNIREQKKTWDKIAEAMWKADETGDFEYLMSDIKTQKKALKNFPERKQIIRFKKGMVDTSMQESWRNLSTNEDGLKYIANKLELDVDRVLDIMEDKKDFEMESRHLTWKEQELTRSSKLRNQFAKGEKWMLDNGHRFDDPAKFKAAYIKRFGRGNAFIKAMKNNRSSFFSSKFNSELMGWKTLPGQASKLNQKRGNSIFSAVIYNMNKDVRNSITAEFKEALSGDVPTVKYQVRKTLSQSPLLKKFGLDKAVRGPISRLIFSEIGDKMYENIQTFRKPRTSTWGLLNYLEDVVGPKYKSQFVEARKAVDYAQRNKWPDAKKSLKIADNINWDHKIPSFLIEAGYADKLEYAKLQPTTQNFNIKIKRDQFDQPMRRKIGEWKKAPASKKGVVIKEMQDLIDNFSRQYGGYMRGVEVTADPKGKPIFTSKAGPFTKKTDVVKSLKTSLAQEKGFKSWRAQINKGKAQTLAKALELKGIKICSGSAEGGRIGLGKGTKCGVALATDNPNLFMKMAKESQPAENLFKSGQLAKYFKGAKSWTAANMGPAGWIGGELLVMGLGTLWDVSQGKSWKEGLDNWTGLGGHWGVADQRLRDIGKEQGWSEDQIKDAMKFGDLINLDQEAQDKEWELEDLLEQQDIGGTARVKYAPKEPGAFKPVQGKYQDPESLRDLKKDVAGIWDEADALYYSIKNIPTSASLFQELQDRKKHEELNKRKKRQLEDSKRIYPGQQIAIEPPSSIDPFEYSPADPRYTGAYTEWTPDSYAGGGMTGIRRPDAVPPKSGPDPQGEGLSYLFNRVKRW